ncbi:Zinc finger MYM-type protein 1 [Anabarilius grahami]|uniref:Zinc finger MYM-type protein 1 n=1 Tax=Anabarilius grahami TaxID=495550 RepID=A0A3N0XKM9_ANAGA|nr:Zinc finger MYM-type protein 1 [Anabarilius grahami]
MDLRKWFTTTSTTTVKTVMPSTSTSTTSDVDRPVTEAHPSDGRRASVTAASHDDDSCPDDLGKDEPLQITLKSYPTRLFGTRNRSFSHAWFQKRDWLEYSVKADAAFCYPCRKFSARSATQIKIGQPQSGTRLDPAFTTKGFHDWKHAVETNKGFSRHEMSKEHLTCHSMWKEKVSRIDKGKEISTLLYAEQIQRNRYYMSSLIDVVEFLVSNQLPLRGKIEAFDHMDEGGSGLFMSLLEFSIRKDPQLAEIVKTIPKNATYTSHEIQNELVAVMSIIVTDAIVKEIGDSWFTVKVDGTRDPTGMENISIVIRYFNEKTLEITERLLVMTIANSGDAQTITNMILSELSKAGLNASKILSQVYDGAAVMSGKYGGVQRLLQEKVGREIPYVHCLNHQLHLVVVHALSAEKAIQDFFSICNALYNFCRKPTVALQYRCDRLKRLLDQRWTGHLATVAVIVSSFEDITSVLEHVSSARTYGAEVRMEAVGLLREVSDESFIFICHFIHKVLLLLNPANVILQGEDTDLLTGMKLVSSAAECVRNLRSEDEFCILCDTVTASTKDAPVSAKRRRQVNKNLTEYVVEETTGANIIDKVELRRLYFSALDHILGEIEQYISRIKEEESQQMMTTRRLLSEHHKVLEAMPSVLSALKLAVTFGASTAMCENSFSVLKNVFTDNRRAMNHTRKSQLVQLAFERDLTKKMRNEWKDLVLRKFNSSTRRLQLF